MIEAVLFDLDNTLLDNDGDQFLEDYTEALGKRLGQDPDRFSQAAMSAGAALMADHPGVTNHDVVVHALAGALDLQAAEVDRAIRLPDGKAMGLWGLPWKRRLGAREAVLQARARGLKTVLATSPIYLEGPIRERMQRAGIDDVAWDLITTSDRFHSAKPHPAYFEEVADLIGVPPASCLMVGDNPFQDLPARKAGLETYFVGEVLPGLDTGPSGTLVTFVPWLVERVSEGAARR